MGDGARGTVGEKERFREEEEQSRGLHKGSWAVRLARHFAGIRDHRCVCTGRALRQTLMDLPSQRLSNPASPSAAPSFAEDRRLLHCLSRLLPFYPDRLGHLVRPLDHPGQRLLPHAPHRRFPRRHRRPPLRRPRRPAQPAAQPRRRTRPECHRRRRRLAALLPLEPVHRWIRRRRQHGRAHRELGCAHACGGSARCVVELAGDAADRDGASAGCALHSACFSPTAPTNLVFLLSFAEHRWGYSVCVLSVSFSRSSLTASTRSDRCVPPHLARALDVPPRRLSRRERHGHLGHDRRQPRSEAVPCLVRCRLTGHSALSGARSASL